MKKEKQIGDIVVHPSYVLQDGFVGFDGKKHRSLTYEADFEYFCFEEKRKHIEDVKGFKTQVYRIKKKLFLKRLPLNTIFVEI